MSKAVKTQKQIEDEYGICHNTFRKWIMPIEKKLKLVKRRPLLAWQVEMIYEFLDKP